MLYRPVGVFLLALVSSRLTADAQTPPFSGTGFIDADIITPSDPSAFLSLEYIGQGRRQVFDRRPAAWVDMHMLLFRAEFADGLSAEIQVNPEFGEIAQAEQEAITYSEALGRLPTLLRQDMKTVTIHQGVYPFGGGNRNILIHTGQADEYGDFLEEILMHESGHTSLDALHSTSTGWLAAQQADGNFISTYARDFPNREDIAESLVPWFAVRHRGSRLTKHMRETISATIPHRMTYLDGLPLVTAGDFNADGIVNGSDIDSLTEQIFAGVHNAPYDITDDDMVDEADRHFWVRTIQNTWFGDANLDGEFNSSDLVAVFRAGEYDDAFDDNSGWGEGDWDGDRDFSSGDLIAAFQDGGYHLGPRTSVPVPEPSVLRLLVLVAIGVWLSSRRSTQISIRRRIESTPR